MKAEKRSRLRIYTTEAAHHEGHCLYEAIIRKSRESSMAGVTVTRGISGSGHLGHTHTARLVELSGNLPIVIDLVDTEERIQEFAEIIVPWVVKGIVTLEAVTLLTES